MEPPERSELLCDWALQAGFDRAGVARLQPAERRRFFLDWLADGRHAGMGYLARRVEVRLDPGVLFPDAKSVLCVALQYHSSDDDRAAANDLWSGVARYARGDDYHDTMGKRLASLARRIEAEFPETITRWYVDTGPVLERELAAASGLGTFGKNTCLLDPEAGSWFLIGEVFTSLDLSPRGGQLADLCGSCSLCLDACPTGALIEAYQMDSSRCISYWTIEHRGEIPPDVRPQLGHWVFGCDICQEVCPHNEGVLLPTDSSFVPLQGRADLTLEDILELDAVRYSKIFKGSPMKRAKLPGLKRNAVVAMGNSGDKRYVECLVRELEKGEAATRGHAAWSLGRLGGEHSKHALEAAAARESNSEITAEISLALERVRRTS